MLNMKIIIVIMIVSNHLHKKDLFNFASFAYHFFLLIFPQKSVKLPHIIMTKTVLVTSRVILPMAMSCLKLFFYAVKGNMHCKMNVN